MTKPTTSKKSPAKSPATKAEGATPLSYAQAYAEMLTAREALEVDRQNRLASDTQHGDACRQMATAIKAENFTLAAELKAQRDTLASAHDAHVKSMSRSVSKFKQAFELCSEAYLAEQSLKKSEVTVNRIHLMNPLTGNSDAADYLVSSDTIQLHLDGESFESEAYHVADWARKNNFFSYQTTATVLL